MDYFMIHQDKRLFYKPQLKQSDIFHLKSMTREQINDREGAAIIYVEENRYNEYTGYIDTPVKLISKNIKKILSKYQNDIIFKPVILIEKESNRQENYYIIAVPELECASECSTRDALGNVKEFILDEEKVEHLRVFQAKDYDNQLFVRLDVAESILRRKTYGILFEKVNVVKRGGEDE